MAKKRIAYISQADDKYVLLGILANFTVDGLADFEHFTDVPANIEAFDGIIVFGLGHARWDKFFDNVAAAKVPMIFIYTIVKPDIDGITALAAIVSGEQLRGAFLETFGPVE